MVLYQDAGQQNAGEINTLDLFHQHSTRLVQALTHRSQKHKKKIDGSSVFFVLWGSECIKAAGKILVKLTPCHSLSRLPTQRHIHSLGYKHQMGIKR